MLKALVAMDIPWEKVDVFHLDEYVGIPVNHKASFRKYLKEKFVEQVKNVKSFHYINATPGYSERDCQIVGFELVRLRSMLLLSGLVRMATLRSTIHQPIF
jgi:6-phosphogluconolactonase/glucosamine-6-phosphate isomerase/deaminase